MKNLISVLIALLIISIPASASAQVENSFDINFLFQSKTDNTSLLDNLVVTDKPEEKVQEKPIIEPEVYVVIEGDNLSKIGTKFNVEWQRLWAKNLDLKHPDIINIGDKIVIPLADEELSREIPPSVSLPVITPGVTKVRDIYAGVVVGDPGNTYGYGYCTWYVKNRRGSSLPNGLGNANTWYSRASNMGMGVGSIPKAGAVGTTTRGSLGHVVYVESVNSDGSVNISEMNYQGWNVVSRRVAQASEFVYIY